MKLNKLEKGLTIGLVGGIIMGVLGGIGSKYVDQETATYGISLILRNTGILTSFASLVEMDLYFLVGKN